MKTINNTTFFQPTLNTEAQEEIRDIRDDLNYLKELIEGNKKEDFFAKGKDKKYQNDMLEADYRFFTKKIDIFKESIGNEYPDFSDFDFIVKYLTKLFIAIYEKNTLLSVFEDKDIKEKFFNCMEKYFYGNFGKMSIELVQKYPKKDKGEQKKVSQILSDNEMKQLLDGIRED